ncbi:hypothetical protein R3P38DRAFT_3184960 [Favolaschia claudopus]|uniref:Uncharacterized protein n=1 Tax=Favolaschia claudopus TaxID=2862362 RepID=A0AAW0ATU9_9AGAR
MKNLEIHDDYGPLHDPWGTPVEGGRRIPPSDLAEYRRTRIFHNPRCLCSLHELDSAHFVESVIFLVTSGALAGEYVAGCAEGVCKYWIFLERMFTKHSQPVRAYHLRDVAALPPVELLDIPRSLPSSATTTPSGSNRRDKSSIIAVEGSKCAK